MPLAEGICSSLIASYIWATQRAVMWGLARLLFWKPRRMEGGWQTNFAKNGYLHEESAVVAQVGHYLRGRIKYHDRNRSYAFSGSVRDGILVARYEAIGKGAALDRGSFTLVGNPVGDLFVLEGCYAWTDDDSQRARSDCYLWTKDGSTKLSDRVYPQSSSIAGTGVFASRQFREGEILGYFEGDCVDTGTDYSLTLEFRQIEPSGNLRHLNHSCQPNAYFRDRWLIADKLIEKDHEITINYLATETMIAKGFECNCGTGNCRHKIQRK